MIAAVPYRGKLEAAATTSTWQLLHDAGAGGGLPHPLALLSAAALRRAMFTFAGHAVSGRP